MAVFHPDHDELHGFTVCIETTGPLTVIGRWHHEEQGQVLVNDAAVHVEGEAKESRADFIKQAATWGVSATHPHYHVERAVICSVRKLGEMAKDIRGW